MLVPALLFLAVVAAARAPRAGAIPMATDIALALGALALAASRAPTSLKPLLLTLAIVDDIGAIIVIALFYSAGSSSRRSRSRSACVGVIVLLERGHVRYPVVYVALGVVLWYATYRAGVHPTIAGVVLGLLTPLGPVPAAVAVSDEARRTADLTRDDPNPPDADAEAWLELASLAREAVSPMARVEHALLPWTSFVIVPLFALANAGVPLSAARSGGAWASPVGWGILVGLVVGKPLGILLASRAATASRLGVAARGTRWRGVAGMGAHGRDRVHGGAVHRRAGVRGATRRSWMPR